MKNLWKIEKKIQINCDAHESGEKKTTVRKIMCTPKKYLYKCVMYKIIEISGEIKLFSNTNMIQ